MNTTASFLLEFFLGNKKITPGNGKVYSWIPTNHRSDINVIADHFKVPDTASDLELDIVEHGESVLVVIANADFDDTEDLEVKVNGNTDARKVNPVLVLSDPISSLEITNNGTAEKTLVVLTVVPIGLADVNSNIIQIPGEINTASNIGSGIGIFKEKINRDLKFKSLVAGSGITLVEDVDTIEINNNSSEIVTVSDNYLADINDQTILIDATSASVTITLPSAAVLSGKKYSLKKIDSTDNLVRVDPDSAELIDGESDYEISLPFESLNIRSDGANWYVF